MRHRFPRAAARLGLTLSLLLSSAPGTVAGEAAVDLVTHVLPSFRIGHPEETRFGPLEWVGGLEVESSERAVGGLSSLVVDPEGSGFLAITDDGLMLRAAIRRDAAGRPVGLADGVLRPMETADNSGISAKWDADTESLDVVPGTGGGSVAISFEGRPRIMTGRLGPDGFVGPLSPVALPRSMAPLRFTKGLESLALGRPGSRFDGDILVIAERAEKGVTTDDQPGWILGAHPARFRVKRLGDYDLTDAKFGPDGDLYVLERLYSLAEGVRARIRRIPSDAIVDGATVDGPVVLAADLSHQIDNMEGLAFWKDADGGDRLSLISDDNRSFLQRTVYLEFKLVR